jgi:hypothetical protein
LGEGWGHSGQFTFDHGKRYAGTDPQATLRLLHVAERVDLPEIDPATDVVQTFVDWHHHIGATVD